jgi:hypothetical protein
MAKLWRALPQRTATTLSTANGVTTAFTVNHNLGHRDVMVQVRQAAGPGYLPMGAGAGGWTITATTDNSVTVTFGTAPAAGQYRVIVMG